MTVTKSVLVLIAVIEAAFVTVAWSAVADCDAAEFAVALAAFARVVLLPMPAALFEMEDTFVEMSAVLVEMSAAFVAMSVVLPPIAAAFEVTLVDMVSRLTAPVTVRPSIVMVTLCCPGRTLRAPSLSLHTVSIISLEMFKDAFVPHAMRS